VGYEKAERLHNIEDEGIFVPGEEFISHVILGVFQIIAG